MTLSVISIGSQQRFIRKNINKVFKLIEINTLWLKIYKVFAASYSYDL